MSVCACFLTSLRTLEYFRTQSFGDCTQQASHDHLNISLSPHSCAFFLHRALLHFHWSCSPWRSQLLPGLSDFNFSSNLNFKQGRTGSPVFFVLLLRSFLQGHSLSLLHSLLLAILFASLHTSAPLQLSPSSWRSQTTCSMCCNHSSLPN